MAVAVLAEPGSTPPRVRVTVSGRGSSTNGRLGVVRVNTDGSTTPVRTAINLSAGQGFTYDYEAPYGVPVSYRTSDLTEGSGTVVLDSPTAWLLHPFLISLSTPLLGSKGDPRRTPTAPVLTRAAFESTSRGSSATTLDVLNREDEIVQRVGRRRRKGSTIEVRTYTGEQAVQFGQLTDDDAALLLNVPLSLRWPVQTAWVLLGDLDSRPLAPGNVLDERQVWSGELRYTARPVGEARLLWASGDVAQTFATSGDAALAYATAGDMATDTRRVG